MPKIPGAQSRVEAGGQLAGGNISLAAANSGLENVGHALDGAVQARQQAAQRKEEAEQRKNNIWREKTVAQSRAEWATRYAQAKQAAPEGADGFTTELQTQFDEWRQEVLDTAPNAQTRQALDADLEGVKTRVTGLAVGYESASSAKRQVTDTQQTFEANANSIRANPDWLAEGVAQNNRLVDALNLLNGDQKRELKIEQTDRAHWAAVNGRIDAVDNAEQATALLAELKGSKAWQAGLKPETYNQALGTLDRLVDQMKAEDEQKFTADLGEQVRELKAGVDNGLTPAVIRANVADPKARKKWTEAVTGARQIMTDMQAIGAASPDQIRQHVAKLQADTQTPGNFDADDERARSFLTALKRRNDMIEADAATYTAGISPSVRKAAQRFAEDPSPENVQRYAIAQTAEQQRLGRDRVDLLSTHQVAGIQAQMADTEKTPEGAQKAYEALVAHATTWGNHWPTVQRQLVDKGVLTGPVAVAANLTSLTDRAAGQTLMRALFTGKKELKTNLGDPALVADINRAVADELDDLKATLVYQAGGMAQYQDYREAVGTLALYLADTQGLENPAAAAANAIINGKYKYQGSYRVPATENVEAIAYGAWSAANTFDADNVVPYRAEGGLGDEFVLEETKKHIRATGAWVNNADETTGLTLTVLDPTGERVAVEVLDESGRPVPYTKSWEELETSRVRVPFATEQGDPAAMGFIP